MVKVARLQNVEYVGTGMADDCGICGDSLTPVFHAVVNCRNGGGGVVECGHKCDVCAGSEGDGDFVICDACLDAAFKNSARYGYIRAVLDYNRQLDAASKNCARYGAVRSTLAEERQGTSEAAYTALLDELDAVKEQVHAVRTLYREKLAYGGLKAFFENVERLTADEYPPF